MNLEQLATKPQLIKITVDDADVVAQYGEPLDFYTWDRQPLELFLKFATSGTRDITTMGDMLQTMVLNAEGQEIIRDGFVLPSKVLISVFSRLVAELGK